MGHLGPVAPVLVRHWGRRQPAEEPGTWLSTWRRQEQHPAVLAGHRGGWGAGSMSQCLTQSRNHEHLDLPALGPRLLSAGVSFL